MYWVPVCCISMWCVVLWRELLEIRQSPCKQCTVWGWPLNRGKEREWEKHSLLHLPLLTCWPMLLCILIMRRRISSERTERQTFLPATVKSLPCFTGTDFVLALYESQYLNYTIRKLNPYPSGAPFPSHWLADWMWMQQVGQKCCRVSWCAWTRPIRSVTTVTSSHRWMKHLAYCKTVLPCEQIDSMENTWPIFFVELYYGVTLHILPRNFFYMIQKLVVQCLVLQITERGSSEATIAVEWS